MKAIKFGGILISISLLAAPLAYSMMTKDGAKKVYGQGSEVEFVEGEFVIQMRRGLSINTQSVQMLNMQLAKLGLKVVEKINAQEGLLLAKGNAQLSARGMGIQAAQSLSRQIASLQDVEFAEPNFIYRASDLPASLPNDPSFSALWGMKNTGQRDSAGTVGKVGADIKAPEAWALHKGSKDVVVAVIDTGVDYNHPDLKANIWSKPGQPNVHGFNAINGRLDPMDDNSHGTHCSGSIGGVGDNSTGVVGVAWNVSIMGVKFLSGSGSGTLADAVKAIDWATNNGAQIMSNSWGGGGYAQSLFDAIKRASDKGILFIAAAGNDGSNNDSRASYPASYELPNIVSVAASTNLDTMADFSNFGARTVHLMAPGHNIVSTTPGNRYESFSGTSMATPHVSGAAALLLAKEPSLTYSEIKERLMSSSDKLKAFRRKLISGGRLNVYNLLANITPPGFITIPDNAWSSLVATQIETKHPYANSEKLRFEINHEGATHIKVHFAKFQSESGYDTLKIYNGTTGELVDSMTGQLGQDIWSIEVDASKVLLEWNSDSSVNDYGFLVDGYSWTSFSGTN